MELMPALSGEAFLALAEGADARLFDANVVTAFRREAEKHLRVTSRQDPKNVSTLSLLAQAAALPETKAGLTKAASWLARALTVAPSPELHARRGETLARLFWRTFGGETLGFPSSAVLNAKQKKQLPELKRQMALKKLQKLRQAA